MELADLLPEVFEWKKEVKGRYPGLQQRSGERVTDVVPASPALDMLLQMLTLSAQMRSAQTDRDSLLSPLLSLEFAESEAQVSTRSHFGSLLEDVYSKWEGGRVSHEIHPLLITTFSDPNGELAVEAAQVLSEIRMENVVSQAALREMMKDHVEHVEQELSNHTARLLSVLHVHVNMNENNARDVVDYLRFQVEWCAQEMIARLCVPGTSGVHVLALVVHGTRGCDPEQSIRPFLFAGPCIDGRGAMVNEWTGAAVDHLSNMLPWGMPSAELLHGTIKQIFGIGEEATDRFRFILADALPHVVPHFRLEHQADSFMVVQMLMQAIHRKPELVLCIRNVLAEQLSLEQAPTFNFTRSPVV